MYFDPTIPFVMWWLTLLVMFPLLAWYALGEAGELPTHAYWHCSQCGDPDEDCTCPFPLPFP